MFKFLPLILKNSWRNRRRTVFTIFSVSLSLALLGVLIAIYQAFYFGDEKPSQALRLVVRHKVSLTFPLPQSYREKILHIPGVREVGTSSWFGGVYKDKRDPKNFFARFAIEPARLFVIRSEMQIPDDQRTAFLRDRAGALVGRPLADKLGFHLGDKITIQGDIYPVNLELTVRAIYEAPTDDQILYFNREYLEQGLTLARRGNVGTFYVLADTPESVPAIAKAIDDEFHNAPMPTKTESERAFALSFLAFLGNVKAFLLIICGAVVFTILLVSANTIAMSVRERVREVGVLKTLGYTPGIILTVILGESVAISFAGGLLGCVFAALLCRMVRSAPAFSDDITRLTLVPSVVGICLAVAVAIGLVSSFIPAWNASRISILEALRNTD